MMHVGPYNWKPRFVFCSFCTLELLAVFYVQIPAVLFGGFMLSYAFLALPQQKLNAPSPLEC